MSKKIEDDDKEIESVDELLITMSELAEEYVYLFDYPILIVESNVKSFMVMNQEDFDKLFKSIVG